GEGLVGEDETGLPALLLCTEGAGGLCATPGVDLVTEPPLHVHCHGGLVGGAIVQRQHVAELEILEMPRVPLRRRSRGQGARAQGRAGALHATRAASDRVSAANRVPRPPMKKVYPRRSREPQNRLRMDAMTERANPGYFVPAGAGRLSEPVGGSRAQWKETPASTLRTWPVTLSEREKATT